MSRLSLDTVTIRFASLEDKFRLTSQTGFQGIELWGEDIDNDEAMLKVRQLLDEYPLIVEGICPQPDMYRWHSQWDKELRDIFEDRLQRYAQIGANYLVLAVMSEEGSLEQTAENLNRVGEIAHRYRIKLGLEPIGHVKKLAKLSDALILLDRYTARAEAGLIVDAFHFFRGGNQIENLSRLDPERILGVHIDDAMDQPMEMLVGYKHRVYPGEGIFDVKGFCKMLKSIGYTGPYIIELLNQEYWQTDPSIVVNRAYHSAQYVLR